MAAEAGRGEEEGEEGEVKAGRGEEEGVPDSEKAVGTVE